MLRRALSSHKQDSFDVIGLVLHQNLTAAQHQKHSTSQVGLNCSYLACNATAVLAVIHRTGTTNAQRNMPTYRIAAALQSKVGIALLLLLAEVD
ncbi:hypothetical protein WJX79_007733 [Trebouxia sp. C0005]